MKILVVAPTPFFSDRGTHIRILEEALALEKLGHVITIATYHIGRDISTEVETKIDIRRIRRLLFWYTKLEAGPDWQKIILDLMLLRKVFYLARTQRPSIIHAHLHEGVLIGWLVQKILFWRNIKLVSDFHGSLTKEMISHSYLSGGWLKAIFIWIEKVIDNLGDYAITSSWENSDEIKALRNDKKIETVLDGVNLDYYKNLPKKHELRKELELPLEKTIVTYTGALIANKGIDFFLQSIPMVLQKNPDVFFVIGGFPIEATRNFIEKNNLQSQVRLINPLNYFDLPRLLAASDIGVDPKDSTTRQASGKILQYMAANLAVVCFDRTNNRNYLNNGAYYSLASSATGLANGILGAVGSDFQQMGALNFEQAKNFSWEKSAEKIEKIYQEKL